MRLIYGLVICFVVAAVACAVNPEFDPYWTTNDAWVVRVESEHQLGTPISEIGWGTYSFQVACRSNGNDEASILISSKVISATQDIYLTEMVINTQKMILARLWSLDQTTGTRKTVIDNPFGEQSWMIEEEMGRQCVSAPDMLVHFPQIPDQRTNTVKIIQKDSWQPSPIGRLARRIRDKSGMFREDITFDPATNRATAVLERVGAETNLGLTTTMTWQGGKKWWLSCEEVNRMWIDDTHCRQALLDSDCDGLPDTWEDAHGFNSAVPDDGNADPDGDGLSNEAEFQNDTDPHVGDTDGDGVVDGREVQPYTNPLDPQRFPATIRGIVTSHITTNEPISVTFFATNTLPEVRPVVFLPMLAPTGGVFCATNVLGGYAYWVAAEYGLWGRYEGYCGFAGNAPLMVTGNIDGLTIDIRNPVKISGVTRHNGETRGNVDVLVSWAADDWNIMDGDLVGRWGASDTNGLFSVPGIVANKSYWIRAFSDNNPNSMRDVDEPWWQFGTNSVLVTNDMTNLVIDLVDP